MWAKITTVTILTTVCLTQNLLRDPKSGVTRHISDGVISEGFDLVIDDKRSDYYKELLSAEQKSASKEDPAAPLATQDVACFIFNDTYCSNDMLKLKNVLIQTIKKGCAKCSAKDQEKAANIAASMINHDPMAWKFFLNRSGIQVKKKEMSLKSDQPTST